MYVMGMDFQHLREEKIKEEHQKKDETEFQLKTTITTIEQQEGTISLPSPSAYV